MDFIFENWYLIICAMAALAVGFCLLYRFAKLPTEEQLDKVREWLLWAVTEAERELGGGTGQLKLRAVYDMFVQRFPSFARVISFSTFSDLVDDALVDMREMLNKNKAVKAIVEADAE